MRSLALYDFSHYLFGHKQNNAYSRARENSKIKRHMIIYKISQPNEIRK